MVRGHQVRRLQPDRLHYTKVVKSGAMSLKEEGDEEWRPAKFVLTTTELRYQLVDPETWTGGKREIVYVLPLKGAQVMMGAFTRDQQDPLAFTILSPNPRCEWLLLPDTTLEMRSWVTALMEVVNSFIDIEDLEILKELGQGAFGKVFLVRQMETQKLFAMKVLMKASLLKLKPKQVARVRTEVAVLQSHPHPFLCVMHHAFQTKGALCMLLDLLPGGELRKVIPAVHEPKMTVSRVRLYAAEIASALGHLHSIGVIHRDLKPTNVMLDAEGHAVLIDYGIAKVLPLNANTGSRCGTAVYVAPEVYDATHGTGYTKAVDWWTFGCVVFEMLTSRHPFPNQKRERLRLANLDPDRIVQLKQGVVCPSDMPADAKSFCSQLLQYDADKRLGGGEQDVEDVLAHPFFDPLDMFKVYSKQYKPEYDPCVPSLAHLKSTVSEATVAQYLATDIGPEASDVAKHPETMKLFLDFQYNRSHEENVAAQQDLQGDMKKQQGGDRLSTNEWSTREEVEDEDERIKSGRDSLEPAVSRSRSLEADTEVYANVSGISATHHSATPRLGRMHSIEEGDSQA